ncbi:MAG: hypothetical protein HPKKFMNG_01838 [Planctomycetes bacterium]|nr:hypothetical protein [Planctomycetota bacterium]
MAEQKKKGSRPMLLLLLVASAAACLIGWTQPQVPLLGPAMTTVKGMLGK